MGLKNDNNNNLKRKNTNIMIDVKKEIIAKHEKGTRVSDLAAQFGMAKSTICTILKNRETIKKADVARGVTVITKQRTQAIEEVEKLLLIWINDTMMAGNSVSEGMVCEKARRLHDELVQKYPGTSCNTDVFKGSRGWLEKFKKRSGLHSMLKMGLKSGSKSGKGNKQTSAKMNIRKKPDMCSSKQTDSDEELDIDSSVLYPSTDIGVSGVVQLVETFKFATDELQSLLARECDIIYECRVCRNLFRSVANMLAHKRTYCKTPFSYTKHTLNRNPMVEDYTVIVQPEPVPSSSHNKQNWTTSDKVPEINSINQSNTQIISNTSRIFSNINSKKGLNEIINKLSRNTVGGNTQTIRYSSSTSKLYENTNLSFTARNEDRTEHSNQLEDVEATKIRMYQTQLSSIGDEKEDLMKDQILELQNMATENEDVLEQDEQMVMINGHTQLDMLTEQNELLNQNDHCGISNSSPKQYTKYEHLCPDCNIQFSSRKALHQHMKSFHVMFRFCYPCPCCKSTFVNPWNVYRHLYRVHRKTNAQVRRLRPQIQKKAFRKEITSDEPTLNDHAEKNDPLNKIRILDLKNQAWVNNFEDDLELQRCGDCGRRFERRAALNSHSKICKKRIAARNNIKTNFNTSTSSNKKGGKTPSPKCKTLEPDNKKVRSKVLDSSSSSKRTVASSRIRHSAKSSSDQPKKTISEKKIEIQIRKYYCKMSSGESVTAMSTDTQSEPESPPPSRVAEDEGSFNGEVCDWESMIEMEEVSKEESDNESQLSESNHYSKDMNNKAAESLGCHSSDLQPKLASRGLRSVKKRNSSKIDFNRESYVTGKENKRKRRASTDIDVQFSDIETNKTSLKKKKNVDTKKSSQLSSGSSSMTKPTRRRKLVHSHPVMEARIQKLINVRRLQCLLCQKKFIKLANLRRHVAVHIGWCRYCCTLCNFKCFAKYDCVDHVCKIHLKGTHRARAANFVQCIDEQHSDTKKNEECITQIALSTDTTDELEVIEPSTITMNFLNIEEIKDIVGVTPLLSTQECETRFSQPINSNNLANNLSKDCDTNDSNNVVNLSEHDYVRSSSNKKFKSPSIIESEVEETNVNYLDSSLSDISDAFKEKNSVEPMESEEIVDPLTNEQEETEEFPENTVEIMQNETESKDPYSLDNEEVQEPYQMSENMEQSSVDSDKQVSCEVMINEEVHSEDNSDDSMYTTFHIPKEGPKEQVLLSDEVIDLTSENEVHEVYSTEEVYPCKSVSDNEEVEEIVINELEEEEDEMEVEEEDGEEEEVQDEEEADETEVGEEREEQVYCEVPESTDKSTVCDVSSILSDAEEKMSDDNSDAEVEAVDVVREVGRNFDVEDQQNALRKMVMEVIFGSGTDANSEADGKQNLYSVSVNGEVLEDRSNDGRSSRVSTTSDTEDIVIDNGENRPKEIDPLADKCLANSEIINSDSVFMNDYQNSLEIERIEHPVRNRVKITKEDFIYDFADSCLKSEDSTNKSVNGNKNIDSCKDTMKYEHLSASNSDVLKCVPKLTLVRTESSEIDGNKLSRTAKESWSTVCTSNSDCVSSRNLVSSSSS